MQRLWMLALTVFLSFSPGDEVMKDLKSRLRSSFPDARATAVRKLAKHGTEEAWELVVKALEDPDPQVADEAQVRLALIADEDVLRGLYGRDGLRSKEEWVRLRVAEALGRMTIYVDGRALVKALSPKDPEVARALCWSLERLARAELLAGSRVEIAKKLDSCRAARRLPLVRAAALSALVALIGVDAESSLSLGLEDRAREVRCAAVAALRSVRGARAFPALRQAAADAESAVRAQAIEELERLGTRACVLALVDRLESEEREALAWRVVRALQSLTGMRYRRDARPWRLFATQLAPDWTRADAAPEPVQGSPTVALAGLPILSDRVAFLVDFSGSLWEHKVGERTRKEILDERVRSVLEALPADTEFNLIPYTRDPIPWADELVVARPQEVRKAVNFFEGCNARGPGNFFDAALLALADPRVDTIVALTDGAPTGGRRWNLPLMVSLLTEETRYRKVAFDSILIDAPRRLELRWEELAAQTGGRSISIELASEDG